MLEEVRRALLRCPEATSYRTRGLGGYLHVYKSISFYFTRGSNYRALWIRGRLPGKGY